MAVRIAGVNLPEDKSIEIALTYIYGIGRPSSKKILATVSVDPMKKVRDLTEEEIARIRKEIETNYMVEGDLRRKVAMDIKRLIEIGCYRGLRHKMKLPVRGQRTRCNARTRKGPKKTVGGVGKAKRRKA